MPAYDVLFFFQAEDGIRDFHVTGVQTCALPIFSLPAARPFIATGAALILMEALADIGTVGVLGVPTLSSGIYRIWAFMYEPLIEIGRASCRERVWVSVVGERLALIVDMVKP